MTVVEAEILVARPDLTPQAELAVLSRALFREGWDDYDVGHITSRQPDGTYLTQPLELGWDEVRASDIIRMDADGNKLEGRWTLSRFLALHLEFHRAQPGHAVTVHQHPRFATIWSAAGRIPPAYDQRSASLADDDIALYDDFEGGVDDRDAALAAVVGIGDKPCALLRNHGAFVVGTSIEHAFNRAIALEWRCKQAWMAEAMGARNIVPAYGHKAITDLIRGAGGISAHLWPWAIRREVRIDPGVLL
jgi:ribulose-5-phosphate 4-epimerase/fuculose-1-phosphate aldolase